MSSVEGKFFAIDLDGTIIDEGLYPQLGTPKPNAIKTMKRILAEGGKIAIWTARGGKEQKDKITGFLEGYGIYDFIINEHFPEIAEVFDRQSPKIYSDYYIDDRSIHATNGIDWFEIEKLIFGEN